MLPRSQEYWSRELLLLRPGSEDELVHQLLSSVWSASVIHIMADRLTGLRGADDMARLYERISRELFSHLSASAASRKWGDHPREKWIDVLPRPGVKTTDKPRSYHTDEAGISRPATLALMYCVRAAADGGSNRFLSASQVWEALMSQNPWLAWNLVCTPLPYSIDGALKFIPALRHRAGRAYVSYNSSLIVRGLDPVIDDLVSAFDKFLSEAIPQSAPVDVTLDAGSAVLWWDELALHNREPARAGAESRYYRKTGIEIAPSPTRPRRMHARRSTHAEGNASVISREKHEVFCALLEAIQKKRRTAPFVVCISGINGSGKTAFAREFGTFLRDLGHRVEQLSVDDFHFSRRHRYQGEIGSAAFYNQYFDIQRLKARILDPLKREGHVQTSLVVLDVETDEFTSLKNVAIDENTIVLLEGVFLFRPELESARDMSVLLDVPAEISLSHCIRRRTGREGFSSIVAKYFDRYLPANMYHVNSGACAPPDFVIDNSDYNFPQFTSAHPTPRWLFSGLAGDP